MHLWKKVSEIALNFRNWLLDRWFFAKRGEKILHVIGKDFSFSSGPVIRLRESRSRGWFRIEGDIFKKITHKSILRIIYRQTRVTKKTRIIKKTIVNPKTE